MLKLNANFLTEEGITGASLVEHFSAAGEDNILHYFHGGALAGAVGAKQAQADAGFDAERKIFDRSGTGEIFFQAQNFKGRGE